MARVFISYAREDTETAIRVHGWLVDSDHEVFLDEALAGGIRAGEDWQLRLYERLRWADAVISLVSTASLASTWCISEVAIAVSRGSRLIPLQLESGPLHPLLTNVQHVDLTGDLPAARQRIEAVLLQIDAAGGASWPDDKCPFPGLRAFEPDQHRVFFGRHAEISSLTKLLRSPAERPETSMLLVTGPSGCGKSSLVRAGLLPKIALEPGWWTLAPMFPGADPVAALARELTAALRGVGYTIALADVSERLQRDQLAAVVDELLLSTPGGRRTRLLLVIDQFEELLTQTPAAEARRFARQLQGAAQGALQIVAALRPEFLDQVLASPDLAELGSGRPFTVRPLTRDALSEVISEPARLAGIVIDDDLVARMVADTEGGEALPLLAYTLEQLSADIQRGGRISLSRYEQLGGVQGALKRQADRALVSATESSGRAPKAVLRELTELVTVNDQNRPTRRRVPQSDLPASTQAELAAFLARRLLITDNDGGGGVVLEVAHEAFITAWKPLADVIAENAAALRAQRRIELAASEWEESGRPTPRLWTGGQLAAACADTGARLAASPNGRADAGIRRAFTGHRTLVTQYVRLSPVSRDFLHAGIRRDRLVRRRITSALSTLLVLALIGAAIAFVQLRNAQVEQRLAASRYLMTQAQSAMLSDPRAGLHLAEVAYHLNPSAEAQASLAQLLHQTHYATTLAGDASAVNVVAFAPDGRTMAMGNDDGTVVLWDVSETTNPRRLDPPLSGIEGGVISLAFDDGGDFLEAAGFIDTNVLLWEVTDPNKPRAVGQIPSGSGNIHATATAFSSTGRTLAVATGDSTDDSDENAIALWDLADPAHPLPIGAPLIGHTGKVVAMAFGPDDRTLADASFNDKVILWDLTDPTRAHPAGQSAISYSYGFGYSPLAFAPVGHTLAVAGLGSTDLWDVTDPARPQHLGERLSGATNTSESVAFSPNGRVVATTSEDHTGALWDVTDPGHPRQIGRSLVGHSGEVISAAFAPGGQILATGSKDGSVILWNVDDPDRPQAIGTAFSSAIRGSVSGIAFAGGSRVLAIATLNHSVTLWNIVDPSHPNPIGPSIDEGVGNFDAVDTPLASNGHIIATNNPNEDVKLYDFADPVRPHPVGFDIGLNTHIVDALAFSPDGRTLVVGSRDKTVSIWDLTDPVHPRQIGPSLTGQTDGVAAVAFSPNGHLVASGGYELDKRVLLWDLTDPAHIHEVGPPLTGPSDIIASVAFSHDGSLLAAGSWDNRVTLWNVTDPEHPQLVGQPLTAQASKISSVAFDPAANILATAASDGTLFLWDTTDPVHPWPIRQLVGAGNDAVNSLAFSPDGNMLAAGYYRGYAVLWDMARLHGIDDRALLDACARTSGSLDPKGWARFVAGLDYEDACPAT